MKTRTVITLSDDERRRLADLLDGKPTRRLAKREEVIPFVEDLVRGALACEPGPAPATVSPEPERAAWRASEPQDERERRIAAEFLARGESEGFIRGYLMVDRRIRETRRAT